MRNFTKTVFGAVVFSVAASATPVLAGAGSDYKLTVHKADLASDAGLRRTIKSIENYAALHCGVALKQPIALRPAAKDCASGLADEIVEKIDNPQLTRRYSGSVRIVRR